ncbi:hypothetical protein [Sphingomonas jatrophae]|uniref:Uncharacterized protein n=1 Tax=Sphingomonas jatrophae TaxID=1166337 RepID=A0A1I6L0R5_9SPHN|nr:hypothetical protein [Sphingomonas jatrophae]SFR97063.1 hypothetical protein SAMN05192580_2115 [Sphingomonas jatrophae]
MAEGTSGIDPEIVEEDIGGVQGSEDGDESDQAADQVAQSAAPGTVPDEPAPDGAEIEWAGAVVKKPPTPSGMR